MIRTPYTTFIGYEDLVMYGGFSLQQMVISREILDLKKRSGAVHVTSGIIIQQPITARFLKFEVVFDSSAWTGRR